MTSPTLKQLTFNAVDGLAFAAARNRLDPARPPAYYTPSSLGPLLEVLHLAAGGQLPDPTSGNWLVLNGAAPLVAALGQKRESWVCSTNRRMGFIRAVRSGPDGDNRLAAFLMDAQRAARDTAGLPSPAPGQLTAAMQELESNIHEHAGATDTAFLAFRAAPGVFEFVTGDRGIGILASLRSCTAHAGLPDHGKALGAALTDGISRHGPDSCHGHGFRPMFVGLLNLIGSLRFRSGDHALTMDGTSPNLATAQIAQKPAIDGFFASVRCHIRSC